MAVRKQRKASKVTRKAPHGDSARSVGLKSRGKVLRVVYKRLEKRPVLGPAIKPDTDGRILAAAVKAVVESSK